MGVLDSIAEIILDGEIPPKWKHMPQITKKEVKIVVNEPEIPRSDKPIALIFGWGGSSHKNINKYSSIYREAGCTTVQYVLPTRHLFRDTEQIPELMDDVLTQLEEYNILDRPVYIHCLCDTGVMCYQGLDITARNSGKNLNIQGVVWDSCPGPFPEVTVTRVFVFFCVWVLCCLRDWTTGEISFTEAVSSTYSMTRGRIMPAFVKKWQGIPVFYCLIQGIWAGDFGRDHCTNRAATPELFLYSNTDFYMPMHYMENTVLASRKKVGAPFRVVKFEGSPHVGHLRNHKKVYTNEILEFVTKGTEGRQNA